MKRREILNLIRDSLILSSHAFIGLVLYAGFQGRRVVLYEFNIVILVVESLLWLWLFFEILLLIKTDSTDLKEEVIRKWENGKT